MPVLMEKALERLCVWAFFGVLFSLLPVIMDVMSTVTRGGWVHAAADGGAAYRSLRHRGLDQGASP